MQYLVLQRFCSLGKTFTKGTVVDGREMRSPRLRQSEGKVIPAVSSFIVPVGSGSEGPAPQDKIGCTNKEVPVEAPKKLKLNLSR